MISAREERIYFHYACVSAKKIQRAQSLQVIVPYDSLARVARAVETGEESRLLLAVEDLVLLLVGEDEVDELLGRLADLHAVDVGLQTELLHFPAVLLYAAALGPGKDMVSGGPLSGDVCVEKNEVAMMCRTNFFLYLLAFSIYRQSMTIGNSTFAGTEMRKIEGTSDNAARGARQILI